LIESDKQVYSFPLSFSFFFYISFLNFEIWFRQNIDADLGRVIAKVSSQLKPSTYVKVTEKKKKKEKRQSEEDTKEQQDDTTQDTPVGASDAVEEPERPKDKKKKKKLKKVNSTSTTNVSAVSIPEKQLDDPPETRKSEPQNPLQEKTSELNNESSNSCLQPPPVKVLSKPLSYV
jgi:hypothetical protein